MDAEINAQEELARIRSQKRLSTPLKYKPSSLAKYRAQLVSLRQAGASYPELVAWLRRSHHKTVHHTTVMRYLKSLPETEQKITTSVDESSINLFENA
jgi:hypothetical protein